MWRPATSGGCGRRSGPPAPPGGAAGRIQTSGQAGRTVDEIQAQQGITYAPLQRQAVELAARTGVLILTGGPGTGKTTTVRGIVALFRRMGLEIVLAAPTGRAAKRMSELTGMEAQTVHRMLGMSWNDATHQVTFTKTEKEPLEADAVIVDEMSMVDLALFSAPAAGPAARHPAGAGGGCGPAALRGGGKRVLRPDPQRQGGDGVPLREVFRQAEQSAIIRNAHAVNLGQPPQLTNNQGTSSSSAAGMGSGPWTTVVELCKTRCRKNGHPGGPDPGADPTRKGPSGTENPLNRCLQAALNPPAADKREIQWGERLFRTGDRIMQTRNDYDVVWGKGGRHRGHRHVQRRRGKDRGDRPVRGVAGGGL